MTDFAKLSLLELEDVLVGLQEEMAELNQRLANLQTELRFAHRDLERRLKTDAILSTGFGGRV